MCPWANHLASLSLLLLIYKMGLMVTIYLTGWFGGLNVIIEIRQYYVPRMLRDEVM